MNQHSSWHLFLFYSNCTHYITAESPPSFPPGRAPSCLKWGHAVSFLHAFSLICLHDDQASLWLVLFLSEVTLDKAKIKDNSSSANFKLKLGLTWKILIKVYSNNVKMELHSGESLLKRHKSPSLLFSLPADCMREQVINTLAFICDSKEWSWRKSKVWNHCKYLKIAFISPLDLVFQQCSGTLFSFCATPGHILQY